MAGKTQRSPKSASARDAELLQHLAARFARHAERHPGCTWEQVTARLAAHPTALGTLHALEQSGGEPDVVTWPGAPDAVVFVDCAAESPLGRRSLCYDEAARLARPQARPAGSAVAAAAALGTELLTPDQYRHLQELGRFDQKTSSWLATPAPIRARGGALFGDRRYDAVFVYHNGAASYYAARGFRSALRL
jgi:hypothetical protein